jgi:cobalt/nickel transport system permease protein
MHWVDRYAYNNRIRKLDPAYKAGFGLVVMLVCLIADRPLVGLLIILLDAGLSIFWAGLPAGFVFKLLTGEGSFLLFGVLGVAISINTIPIPGGLAFGPFWVMVTPGTIYLAIRLLFRALGCVSAMNFLALTTPMVDLIDLLRRMHVSEILIDLMTLIYRFVFTLLDSLDRMVLAQEVRMGFNGWRNSLQSTSNIGANLFIEALRRSRRLETALEGRGWDGSFRVIPQEYERLKWPWKQ